MRGGTKKQKLASEDKDCVEEEEEEGQEEVGSEESESDLEVDSGSEGKEEEAEKKKDAWKEWKKGGWSIDQNVRPPFGPTLHLQEKQLVDELAYFCHFNPSNYLDKQMLPAIDAYGKKKNPSTHTDISETEFMTFLGLMYAMEVVKLPIRHMYWEDIYTVASSAKFRFWETYGT